MFKANRLKHYKTFHLKGYPGSPGQKGKTWGLEEVRSITNLFK